MADLLTSIDAVKGFRAAGVHAGLKKSGAPDMALVVSSQPCVTAGVFTTNKVKAAPVLVNIDRLQHNPEGIRAVVVNTVSANACTGELGIQNAERTAAAEAEHLGVAPQSVLVMSTGVIGSHLPMQKIIPGVQQAYEALGDNWADAAAAIMTTDLQPKLASVRVRTVHGEYTIAGIAKGSGMIAPNMATMLGVIVTDARLSLEQASSALSAANGLSFNKIVVDGDTSTNDMVMLMANGVSGIALHDETDIALFIDGLTRVCTQLAQAIVRDGEGVTKFITISVANAASAAAADAIARTIATSQLVKTAFYGSDANWGRIIAAAGRAGVIFDPDTARLWIRPGEAALADDEEPGLLLFSGGQPTGYEEKAASEIMASASIYVTLDCGTGDGSATIWTCDLSHDYVSINADYRT